MKTRWAGFVKDYLAFSKRERNGLLFLLFLGVIITLLSIYYPVAKSHVDTGAFQKELAQLKISIDTSHNSYAYQHDENNDEYNRPKNYNTYNTAKSELFEFDPNTLDAEGWQRLGLREKTVNTIHNFIAKGYRFRKADDLRKIYGLRPQDADRLVPYVRIAVEKLPSKTTSSDANYTTVAKEPVANLRKVKIIDINAADTADFISLPGIGSKLAARIVNFREKLGGFNSVNQLGETYGIPDSTFEKIKVRLECKNPAVKKININTSDASQLKTHPYIKWNIANAIVNYRNQHGAYKSIEDLRKIEILPDEIFNKIAPYLVL
jgi:competence ComEA-like helix-hairpin-helix protein